MPGYNLSPAETREIADEAAEAIRALCHATLPADGFPGLEYPVDAYHVLGSLELLASRLPQLLTQLAAFLQRELQADLVTIAGGEFYGDPLGAIGTASEELEGVAVQTARQLAEAIDAAQQAIAFASVTDREC